MKKALYTLFIIISCALSMHAQNLAVKSFDLDETDVTANLQGTMVLDQNGEKCALIKIFTTATGFSFDVGSMGVQKVEQHTGEIWVYVPFGVKRITLNHQQLGRCEYHFPIVIIRARTYHMELVAGEVQTIVKKAKTSQYVLFKVTPKDAMVMLDDQLLKTVGGTATKLVPFGSYTYRVQAPDHETEVGKVTVNDPNNKHVVTINLQPAFTTVTIKGMEGADIYVNEEKKGTGSWTGTLGYGPYQVECRKSGYRPAQQEITISKEDNNRTYTLPSPTPIYGTLDINSAPANAKVSIDGKHVGETPLVLDQILEGEHQVVLSLDGYATETKNISIAENQTASIAVEFKKFVIQEMTWDELEKKIKGLQGNKKELSDFIELQMTAANQGNAIAQNHLGTMYYYGVGVPLDHAEAVKWHRKAAEQGLARAQCNLGIMYKDGWGVTKDYAEAVKWYRKAAEQGYAYAQFNLGIMYTNGWGVTKDYAEAVKWYRKAAEQGYAYAQFNLGTSYYDGQGVTKDYAEAVKWYRKAAEQGHAGAQNLLGIMYVNGQGVTKDNAEAVKWFRKAAEQGDSDAQNLLGRMYENGWGVTEDKAEAVKWYRKAAEQGDAAAIKSLKDLESQGCK